MTYLWGASGGIPYHLAALRYRHNLWQPFITSVNDWLIQEWKPRARELLIFGSSAGWTLEKRFLSLFSRIIAVEPDPVAGFLLRRRFPEMAISIVARADLLPWFSIKPGEFAAFLEAHSESAILFSNILGQLELLKKKMTQAPDSARSEFLIALKDRAWASYHDLLSSNSPTSLTKVHLPMNPPENIADLADRFFPSGATVIDHETSWITEGRECQLLPWRLRPEQYHIVGCVWSSNPRRTSR